MNMHIFSKFDASWPKQPPRHLQGSLLVLASESCIRFVLLGVRFDAGNYAGQLDSLGSQKLKRLPVRLRRQVSQAPARDA